MNTVHDVQMLAPLVEYLRTVAATAEASVGTVRTLSPKLFPWLHIFTFSHFLYRGMGPAPWCVLFQYKNIVTTNIILIK